MEIVKFNNEQFGELRIADIGGNPWFMARDVCSILGLENVSQKLTSLDDDEKSYIILNDVTVNGGTPKKLIVSESGFYSLVLSSRKPEAKSFKKWVTSEVLPSIRRTGSYSLYERVDSADLSMKCEFLKQVRLSAQNLPGWQRRQAIVQSLESVGLRVKAGINDETADFVNAVVTKDIQYFEHLKENHPTLYDSIASNFERNRIRSNDIIKAYQIMCNPTLSSKAVMAKIREYDSRFSVSEVSRISSEKYYKIQ